jgi:multiple sugar transport system ATP-binding protein
MAAEVILNNVNKIYPNGVQAVFDFNIEIEHGEFIVLCGPSGCGKSTTLRMIAGLEDISSGDLIINGKRCNDEAPRDRDIAMVFQNYALYGNMTVYQNLAFSLMIRNYDTDEIHVRVMEAAEILGLVPYLNRLPKQLSGGQRQRVAVGRSIVRRPICYLLDEPLSNLDAKLRGSMRKELSLLHHKLGTTFIYVTHDQIEALTLASRIVVMSAGRVQQIATPKEMFDNPSNLFVATFIGTPPMNLINVVVTADGYANVVDSKNKLKISDEKFALLKKLGYVGKEVVIGIRPEYLYVDNESKKLFGNVLTMEAEYTEQLGSYNLVYGTIDNTEVIAKIDDRDGAYEGKVEVSFDMSRAHFYDKDTTNRIVDEEAEAIRLAALAKHDEDDED